MRLDLAPSSREAFDIREVSYRTLCLTRVEKLIISVNLYISCNCIEYFYINDSLRYMVLGSLNRTSETDSEALKINIALEFLFHY